MDNSREERQKDIPRRDRENGMMAGGSMGRGGHRPKTYLSEHCHVENANDFPTKTWESEQIQLKTPFHRDGEIWKEFFCACKVLF